MTDLSDIAERLYYEWQEGKEDDNYLPKDIKYIWLAGFYSGYIQRINQRRNELNREIANEHSNEHSTK